jgi:hypothetical protein
MKNVWVYSCDFPVRTLAAPRRGSDFDDLEGLEVGNSTQRSEAFSFQRFAIEKLLLPYPVNPGHLYKPRALATLSQAELS